jgi:hypothetical protein
MLTRLPAYSLSAALIGTALCFPAYADSSPDAALEQQALTDAVGKPVGGYFYTSEQVQYTNYPNPTVLTNNVKILWLPWGVVKTNINGVENDVVFLLGYDSFKLNCSDPGNINRVCLTGGQSDQALLTAADYKVVNGQPVLAGKPATLKAISPWQAPLTSKSVTVNDLSNGYTGIFYQRDDGSQGVSQVGDYIYLLQNGVVSDGGRVPVSGSYAGFGQTTPNPDAYSFTSTMTFADAGPGSPDSIIVTFKGTAPTGPNSKVQPLNKTAVYSDSIGAGYSGFSPDGL